ncbi:hypothetical protein ACIQZB_25325 [Streptomyces sp. NPDC097727]|uniref:hypothetical protein n=1 Tax=Streptomyces sp. NPDC097727 TaxID=3366092 RepID=UPI00382239E1
MSPKLRRITAHEEPAGLEPLAVFVGHGSLILTSSSWDRVRYQAWDRMAAVRGDERAPQLPTKPWPLHGLRHTFALRLLDYLMRRSAERVRAEKRAGMPRRGERRRDFPHEDAEAGPPKIGGQQVVASDARGRMRTLVRDPAAFTCRVLAQQLADEWVEYVEVTSRRAGTATRYRQAVTLLCRFVDDPSGRGFGAFVVRSRP